MWTNIFCKHEYEYCDRVIFAVTPPSVKGVCRKCGKTITIPYEEYKRIKVAQSTERRVAAK